MSLHHTIIAVRNIEWGTKVELAKSLDLWESLREVAVTYLDETQPPGMGISSSDINHVTMGLLEAELVRRLEEV